MSSEQINLNITIENVPPQYAPEITERLKISIKAILEEYGARGVQSKEGKT